jgi:hypothetical protein
VEVEEGGADVGNWVKYFAYTAERPDEQVRLLHVYIHKDSNDYPLSHYLSRRLLQSWLAAELIDRTEGRFAGETMLWPVQNDLIMRQFRDWAAWLKA